MYKKIKVETVQEQREVEKRIDQEILKNCTFLMSDLLEKQLIEYEEIKNYYNEDEEKYKDVFEWYFISEWLFNQLNKKKAVVISSEYGFIYGRACTGQALYLDGIFQEIFNYTV